LGPSEQGAVQYFQLLIFERTGHSFPGDMLPQDAGFYIPDNHIAPPISMFLAM
jgi:hypothetical protein